MSTYDAYQQQLVQRKAPRWAWEIIDETLDMDANSSAFDADLRNTIQSALEAMIEASDEGFLEMED